MGKCYLNNEVAQEVAPQLLRVRQRGLLRAAVPREGGREDLPAPQACVSVSTSDDVHLRYAKHAAHTHTCPWQCIPATEHEEERT